MHRLAVLRSRSTLLAAAALLGASCALVAAKPLNIDFDAFGGYGVYESATLANPAVQGVDIMMDWSSVETRPGIYDFGPADAAAAAWARAGKRFAVIIRYTREAPHGCDKDQRLPRWIIAVVPHFCDAIFGNVIPDYFDEAFKAALGRYVQAVGKHFAESPYRDSLIYVRVGLGLGSEGFYMTPCRRDSPCDFATGKAKLVEWGWSPQRWRRWQIELLQLCQQAFPYAPVIYPLVRLDIDPDTGNPIQMDVAYWAAAHGFGLGALGLSPRFADGPARIREIMLEASRRHPSTFIQLQTVRPVRDLQEMQDDIALARALKARAIEWYATDLVDPEYQSSLQNSIQ